MHRIKFTLLLCFAFLLFASVSMAQTYSISGKVIDSDKDEALPGTSVFIKSLSRGDVTDNAGSFLIERIPGGTYTVTVSFFGYKTMQTR